MPRSIFFESMIVIAGGFLWSCAAQEQPPKPPVSLSPAMPVGTPVTDPASVKAPVGIPVDTGTFVLGVQDQVQVSLWDEPRLNGTYLIRPDGKISLPLIDEIQAAGLTPMQLQNAIDQAAGRIMQTPRSHVNVVAVNSHRIYFDGEGIAQPGEMIKVIPIRLLDAISARGSFKDFADKKHIRIIRNGKLFMVVNYADLTNGKHPEKNILLEDNDHVQVK